MIFSLSAQDKQIGRSMWDSIMDPFSSGKTVFSVNFWFGQRFQLYCEEKQFSQKSMCWILL